MDITHTKYEGAIDSIYAAQTFAWWLSDQKFQYPTQVSFTGKDGQFRMCYFGCEKDRDLWAAGFESLLESRLNPVDLD